GKQGPYLLPDEGGATGRPVVPGSERVWLDGERLSRGEAADYSMDDDRGRLTFTSRRPITSASRIAVDYEVANTAYRRSALAMPSENRIVGGGASVQPLPWLAVGGEVAASTADPNLLSRLGDRGTQGSAGKASLRATPTLHWGGSDRGRLEANVDWNRRDPR